MEILLYVILVAGAGLLVYAAHGLLKSGSTGKGADDKEERINALCGRIISLEAELAKAKSDWARAQEELIDSRGRQAELEEELRRREEWVKKSEEELKRSRNESQGLRDKFAVREKEIQNEFNKSVNADKQINELKEKVSALEKENRQKADQIEAQKYEVERYAGEAKKHLEVASELKRKEESSQWVPKQEFDKLNEECAKLEEELEQAEDKLKKMALGPGRKETSKESQPLGGSENIPPSKQPEG